MPVLIKGFPQCRENKEQGSSGQTLFDSLLQCMVASKQESWKDKALKLVLKVEATTIQESHIQSLRKSPSQVSGLVSKRGHRRPESF